MPTPKTLGEQLVGLKVRATKNCNSATAGKIYAVKKDNVDVGIGEEDTRLCNCIYSWIPVSSLTIKGVPHKHKISNKCESCGEEVK